MSDASPVAFVLAGGASLGAIQVGMLEALYERDIVPDLILGSSVGAVNGAFIASRPPSVATAHALGDVWRGLHRSTILPLDPLAGLLGFAGRRDSLLRNGALTRMIARNVQFKRLEDAPIPLHVTATDVLTGGAVRLSSGRALDAVLASAAIPGTLPAVSWHGRALVDGGVSDNTPLSHAAELNAATVYVLPTGSACALTQAPQSALAMMIQAIVVLIRHRMLDEIERYAGPARLVVLPPPCPQSVGPLDFSRADELISRSRDGARAHLDAPPADALDADHPLRTHTHSP